MKIGPTGKFPEGKISADDHGELVLAIGVDGGNVKIMFGAYVDWLALPPRHAREFAQALLDKADEIEKTKG